MEIIGKTNQHNIQVYNMSINYEKAKIYRKKVVEYIKFCRFEYLKNRDCYNLINNVENNKTLYEFEIYCLGYKLKTYTSSDSSLMYYQQEKFLKNYLKNGLSDFKFIHLPDELYYNSKYSYIFLNQIQSKMVDNKTIYFSDNVAIIDKHIMGLYLLEKGLIKEASYYLNCSEWNEILQCFEFVKGSSDEYLNCKNEDLEKTIKLHRPIFRYIQDKKIM